MRFAEKTDLHRLFQLVETVAVFRHGLLHASERVELHLFTVRAFLTRGGVFPIADIQSISGSLHNSTFHSMLRHISSMSMTSLPTSTRRKEKGSGEKKTERTPRGTRAAWACASTRWQVWPGWQSRKAALCSTGCGHGRGDATLA